MGSYAWHGYATICMSSGSVSADGGELIGPARSTEREHRHGYGHQVLGLTLALGAGHCAGNRGPNSARHSLIAAVLLPERSRPSARVQARSASSSACLAAFIAV